MTRGALIFGKGGDFFRRGKLAGGVLGRRGSTTKNCQPSKTPRLKTTAIRKLLLLSCTAYSFLLSAL